MLELAERAVRGFNGTLEIEGYNIPVAIIAAEDITAPGRDETRFAFRVVTTGPPVERQPRGFRP